MSGRIRCSILPRTPILAFADDGNLATFAICWGIEPAASVEAWINVHPEHRGKGLGTWSVRWAELRTRRYLTPGTWTLLRPSVSSDEGRLPRGYGVSLRPHVLAHVAATRWGGSFGSTPMGVAIRPYRDGDGPTIHRVLEAAFEGHFGFERMAYDAWEAANLRRHPRSSI